MFFNKSTKKREEPCKKNWFQTNLQILCMYEKYGYQRSIEKLQTLDKIKYHSFKSIFDSQNSG